MNTLSPRPVPPLRIGIVGTGNVARALGGTWSSRGHLVTFAGRTPGRAESLASEIGCGADVTPLGEVARGVDVVLLAVPWSAVDDVLDQLGPAVAGSDRVVVIDPTNPVEHGVGRHLLEVGSGAERIAARASGAPVVKAFNLHPASHWAGARARDVVLIAGDEPAALDVAGRLMRDVGASPHVLGGLDRARQVEELAGTVIALAFAGIDPTSAVPGS